MDREVSRWLDESFDNFLHHTLFLEIDSMYYMF